MIKNNEIKILKRDTFSPLQPNIYKFEMLIPQKSSTFVRAYKKSYDMENWFIPEMEIKRVLSCDDSTNQVILSLQMPLKTYMFFPSATLNCCLISSSIPISDHKHLLIKKEIKSDTFKDPLITDFFVTFI